MFNPFAYLREKSREAMLAGIHDALVQLDAATQQPLPSVSTTPQPSSPQSPDTEPSGSSVAINPPGESLQQRLARAAEGPGANPQLPQLPPAPSAPIRGRGRPPKGDKT